MRVVTVVGEHVCGAIYLVNGGVRSPDVFFHPSKHIPVAAESGKFLSTFDRLVSNFPFFCQFLNKAC